MKKVLSLLLTVMLLFALAVPAMPVEFTPSAEGAGAPGIVKVADSKGNLNDAILYRDGEEIGVGEGEEYQLVVSVLDDADLIAQAIKFAAANGYAEDEIAVTDLFDVALSKNGEIVPVPEGYVLFYKIQSDLTADDAFLVLHNYAPAMWEIVNGAELGENNVVAIKVSSLSPFAIVKLAKTEAPIIMPGTDILPSPQTGDSFPVAYVVCAMLCACAAVVLFKKAGKKA